MSGRAFELSSGATLAGSSTLGVCILCESFELSSLSSSIACLGENTPLPSDAI